MNRNGRCRRAGDDSGVSLVELLVVTVLIGLVGTLGLTTLSSYADRQDHQGSANELVSSLRLAAQRSLSEGRTFCVHVDPTANTHRTFRRSCSATGSPLESAKRVPNGVDLLSSSFSAPSGLACPGAGQCVYLFPRGTAAGGSAVLRQGTKDITVTVEGLTSRVDRD